MLPYLIRHFGGAHQATVHTENIDYFPLVATAIYALQLFADILEYVLYPGDREPSKSFVAIQKITDGSATMARKDQHVLLRRIFFDGLNDKIRDFGLNRINRTRSILSC